MQQQYPAQYPAAPQQPAQQYGQPMRQQYPAQYPQQGIPSQGDIPTSGQTPPPPTNW